MKFDPPNPSQDFAKDTSRWIQGLSHSIPIDFQPSIPRPTLPSINDHGSMLPYPSPILVGIDPMLDELHSHVSHLSSTLLTGALGSGKTSVAKSVAQRMRRELLYHIPHNLLSLQATGQRREPHLDNQGNA